jgi:hypothetical protein
MPVVVRRGVTVRKYFYIGVLVATALVAALPAAASAATPVHVLTTGKVGGPAVAPKAVLKASLVTRTSVVFATSLGKLTCTKSTFTAKVVTNPVKGTAAKPATATESITAETFAGCTIKVTGFKVIIKSITVANLPYNATVSDAKGNPVKISGRSKAKPLLLSVVVQVGTGKPFTCGVKAASIAGAASNKGSTTAFVKQKFTKSSGGALCPASGTFSATYGPVRDTSVKGSPAIFVN